MGSDKGRRPFLGGTLIERVIGQLQGLADEIIVTSNQPDDYAFLGLPVFTDTLPGRGALGGLFTALQAASHEQVAVVACDLPFVSAQLLQHLHTRMTAGDWDVVIPTSKAGLEPLQAVYRRETCLPAVQAALQQGEWKLISFFPRLRVLALPLEQVRIFDPQERIFLNVNTPRELALAEKLAKE